MQIIRQFWVQIRKKVLLALQIIANSWVAGKNRQFLTNTSHHSTNPKFKEIWSKFSSRVTNRIQVTRQSPHHLTFKQNWSTFRRRWPWTKNRTRLTETNSVLKCNKFSNKISKHNRIDYWTKTRRKAQIQKVQDEAEVAHKGLSTDEVEMIRVSKILHASIKIIRCLLQQVVAVTNEELKRFWLHETQTNSIEVWWARGNAPVLISQQIIIIRTTTN